MRKLLIGMLLLVICSCSRSLESAREKAIDEFEYWMYESDINGELFIGPTLVRESENDFVFHWESNLPIDGTTIFEIIIPKHTGRIIGHRSKGKRDHYAYLTLTSEFPFNEALLNHLFDLPPTAKVINERIKRLQKVDLTAQQMEDAANFVEIKRRLHEYYFKYNKQYPNNLDKFNLDSLFIRDQYSNEYIYINLDNFVVLGSQGKNGKWDFEKFDINSVFNDQKQYIFKSDDDILVKFMPVYR